MGEGDQTVRVDGRRLRLTNLDKVLYPDSGTTKGEVIDYYTRIAPLLLPWIADRPVTRRRWPDGVGTADQPGPSFFAKDLEASAPAWVRRVPIDHSGGAKDYPVVDDLATLVYLAQTASLELHVPQWRFRADGTRALPDRLVLDLDPGPGTGLAECAAVARWAREILQGMALDPVPVTSGSKGIHLYATLPGERTADEVSAVAQELARAIEADHPELVVSTMAKAARAGRVLIDWSQNSASKTTVAPYSLRGRPLPTVAAPRGWEELEDPGLRHLTFTELLERVDRPLSAYLAKRTPDRTPEPMPVPGSSAPPATGASARFVIQEHHARRLHWDLRLERGGVFVSWAVPRGIPTTSERNHLAVMTEDHPLEYGSFEGTIPRGEYGAGTVTIWDEGRYEPEKWRDDEIVFTAVGRPGGPLGTVRLALIRTDGVGERSRWLLHRMTTDADGRRASGTPAEPHTAPTDATGGARTTLAAVRPMLATAATPSAARAAAARWAGRGGRPWVEAKWDGIRAIGVWDGHRLRLYARSGAEITDRYPEVTAAGAGLGAAPAVVDGEIVALDSAGRPSFALLQSRMHLTRPADISARARRTPVSYVLFDAPASGRDLTAEPLARRREALEALTADAAAPLVVAPVFDDVDAALEASRRLRLEGIVVKDPSSPYRAGARSDEWLKVTHTLTQEVVIGGIRPGRGERAGSIGSLLVGIPDAGGLRYVGRVGTGFSRAALDRLGAALEPLRAESDPFHGVPPADAADALWVRPDLVGEVELSGFSPLGMLRHPRWRGLRPDRSPADISPPSPE